MSVFTEMEDILLGYMQNNRGEIERGEVIGILDINETAANVFVRKLTKVGKVILSRDGNKWILLLPWKAEELGIAGTYNQKKAALPEDVPTIERQNLINRLWKVSYV